MDPHLRVHIYKACNSLHLRVWNKIVIRSREISDCHYTEKMTKKWYKKRGNSAYIQTPPPPFRFAENRKDTGNEYPLQQRECRRAVQYRIHAPLPKEIHHSRRKHV